MTSLNHSQIKDLKIKATQIRVSVLEMLAEAGSGHLAGSLGMSDVFAFLYFHLLKYKINNPSWSGRDLLVLSNGHICPVLYATLAEVGFLEKSELKSLRKLGSRLQGHPHRHYLPFLETSSGPLGSGLSQAVGMALADQIDQKEKYRFVYCLMSDGEIDEGNTWEAVMLAGKYKLNNLIAVIDRNHIQLDGSTENILPLEPLLNKWKAFNWEVLETSGHDFNEMNLIFEKAQHKEKPVLIIAYTVPGKGVKEFENDYKWHGMAPTKEQAQKAIEELEKIKPSN